MDNWEHVQQLFAAAADLAPAEQSRFLERACADPEIRQEVEELLLADTEAAEALSRTVQTEAALLIDSPVLPGDRLGAYRVVTQIGSGCMGAVYLATRDDDEFQKRVAIKIVKLGMDTAEVLARFRHERQILANLDHHYVARLLDGGTTASGRPYFVMDYVEGRPIDAFCRERSLDTESRCRLFVRALEAVAYAHRNLVVHRDLKPANIFVTGDGSPKLLDFGIAKLLTADSGSGLTATAMARPFTPEYASPEQILGTPVTTAADIYAMGVVLYELLTDQRAYPAGARTRIELEREICDGSIVPPREHKPAVARELENIVLMAVRKEPERRYASADQFAADIERYLDGWPVIAQPDSWTYRARKFVRRQAYPLLGAALIVLSLAAGLIASISQARRAENEAQRARARMTQMLDLSNLSLSEAYAERVSGATEARDRFMHTSNDLLDKLSLEAHDNPPLQISLATAYLRLAQLQGDLQSPNRGGISDAIRNCRAACTLLEPLSRDPKAILLWLALRELAGKLMLDVGDPNARKHLLESLQVASALVRDHPGEKAALQAEAKIRHWLSGSFETAADYPHAIEVTRLTLATLTELERRFPDDAELVYDLSITETRYGWELINLGDPAAAAPHYEAALTLRERIVEQHPGNMLYRRSLKLAYEHVAGLLGSPLMANLGRPEEARKYFQKARALEQAAFDDPQRHLAQSDYAHFLLMASIIDAPAGELDASLAGLREAAALYESFAAAEPGLVSYHWQLAVAHTYMGHRLFAKRDYAGAAAEYRRGLAEAEQVLARLPRDRTASEHAFEAERGIARSLAFSGDRSGAMKSVARLPARARDAALRDNSKQATYRAELQVTLAEVHRKLGQEVAGCAAARNAIALLQPIAAIQKGDPRRQLIAEAQSLAGGCGAPR